MRLRTSHILAAPVLAWIAAAASPVSAIPQAPPPAAVATPESARTARAAPDDVDADAARYAERETTRDRKVDSFEGGRTVVIAVSATTVLLVAILLVLLL